MDDHQNGTNKEEDTIAQPEIDETINSREHQQQPTSIPKRKKNICMIILTGIIAISTLGNVIVFHLASKDTSEQTTRLIAEASKIATSMNETVA